MTNSPTSLCVQGDFKATHLTMVSVLLLSIIMLRRAWKSACDCSITTDSPSPQHQRHDEGSRSTADGDKRTTDADSISLTQQQQQHQQQSFSQQQLQLQRVHQQHYEHEQRSQRCQPRLHINGSNETLPSSAFTTYNGFSTCPSSGIAPHHRPLQQQQQQQQQQQHFAIIASNDVVPPHVSPSVNSVPHPPHASKQLGTGSVAPPPPSNTGLEPLLLSSSSSSVQAHSVPPPLEVSPVLRSQSYEVNSSDNYHSATTYRYSNRMSSRRHDDFPPARSPGRTPPKDGRRRELLIHNVSHKDMVLALSIFPGSIRRVGSRRLSSSPSSGLVLFDDVINKQHQPPVTSVDGEADRSSCVGNGSSSGGSSMNAGGDGSNTIATDENGTGDTTVGGVCGGLGRARRADARHCSSKAEGLQRKWSVIAMEDDTALARPKFSRFEPISMLVWKRLAQISERGKPPIAAEFPCYTRETDRPNYPIKEGKPERRLPVGFDLSDPLDAVPVGDDLGNFRVRSRDAHKLQGWLSGQFIGGGSHFGCAAGHLSPPIPTMHSVHSTANGGTSHHREGSGSGGTQFSNSRHDSHSRASVSPPEGSRRKRLGLGGLNEIAEKAFIVGVFFPLLSVLIPKWEDHIIDSGDRDCEKVVYLVSGEGRPRNILHRQEDNSTQTAAKIMKSFLNLHYPTLRVVLVHSKTNIFRYDENIRFVQQELMPLLAEERNGMALAHGDAWRSMFHITASFADGSPARISSINAALRLYRPSFMHIWDMKTFWHEAKICEDDVEVHTFEDIVTIPPVPKETLDVAEAFVVNEMLQLKADFVFKAQYCQNDLSTFWHRKTKKPVLAVLLVHKEGCDPVLYRGINMEVSMPTGSLCAERNVIGTALASDLTLHRKDLKMVAVMGIVLPNTQQATATATAAAASMSSSSFPIVPNTLDPHGGGLSPTSPAASPMLTSLGNGNDGGNSNERHNHNHHHHHRQHHRHHHYANDKNHHPGDVSTWGHHEDTCWVHPGAISSFTPPPPAAATTTTGLPPHSPQRRLTRARAGSFPEEHRPLHTISDTTNDGNRNNGCGGGGGGSSVDGTFGLGGSNSNSHNYRRGGSGNISYYGRREPYEAVEGEEGGYEASEGMGRAAAAAAGGGGGGAFLTRAMSVDRIDVGQQQQQQQQQQQYQNHQNYYHQHQHQQQQMMIIPPQQQLKGLRKKIVRSFNVTTNRSVVQRVAPVGLNPLKPCGACMEWLRKIEEVNPDFKVLTFTDTEATGVYIESIGQIY